MRSKVWAGARGAWAGGSAQAACTGRGRQAVKAEGAKACAARTENMPLMVVTLDVSQLEMSALKFCKL